VEEGSVAERAGLRPGDTILEVNGTPFRAVTHEEALKVSPTFLATAAFLLSPTPQLRPRYLLILATPLAFIVSEGSISLNQRYKRKDSIINS